MLVLEKAQRNTRGVVKLCFLGFSPQKKTPVGAWGAGLFSEQMGLWALSPCT